MRSVPEVPVAVMAFDRPAYLARVLQSVVRQADPSRFRPKFFLFQDGAVSPRTGTSFADPAAIAASIEVFKRYIPQGVVFESSCNLGVAFNFDRAERLFFEELNYDFAIFLEDDMLLQSFYFELMGELMEICSTRDDIGMVSAYGLRLDMPLAEQRQRSRELCLMNEHNWAFGLTGRCWRDRDAVIAPYLDLIRDIDYRDRSKRKNEILAFQHSLGRTGAGYLSSQDSIKNLASEALGYWRLSTVTNNALYIGRKGEHMNDQKFMDRGYAKTVLFDAPHGGFEVPDIETLRRLAAAA